MNAIIGFSELLYDELYGKLNEKQKEYVGDILIGGRRLHELIMNVLEFSDIDSGKTRLHVSSFRVCDILNSSVNVMKEESKKHAIQIYLEIAPGADIEIEADAEKLREIMFNLLDNAMKFTPDGGSVRVAARSKGQGQGSGKPEERTPDPYCDSSLHLPRPLTLTEISSKSLSLTPASE